MSSFMRGEVRNMTGKELYDRLKAHGAENIDLVVFKDNGEIGEIDAVRLSQIIATSDERDWELKVVLS